MDLPVRFPLPIVPPAVTSLEKLGAFVLGLVLTTGIFILGFYPSFHSKPPALSRTHGVKSMAITPQQEETEEELYQARETKPLVQPKVSMTPQVAVRVDMPKIKVNYSVNPLIETGMEAPVMPQIAVAPVSQTMQPFTSSELDVQPMALFSPFPPYPMQAKLQGKEGEVVVRLVIDPQGHVLSSSLMPGAHNADFGSATLSTVKNWRFKPAEKNGKPVMCVVEIPIRFRLRR